MKTERKGFYVYYAGETTGVCTLEERAEMESSYSGWAFLGGEFSREEAAWVAYYLWKLFSEETYIIDYEIIEKAKEVLRKYGYEEEISPSL